MDLNLKGNGDKAKIEKQQQDVSHLNEIRTQIANINRRYSKMEENFKKQGDLLDTRNSEWEVDVNSSNSELDELKNEIEYMKNTLSKDIKVMESIIVRFKDAAKLTDYNLTQEALEKWKLENMITKDKFKRLLLRELESRID